MAFGALVADVTGTEVVVQVSDPPGVAVAVGGVTFVVTIAVAVLVQPLVGLLTVTV